MFKHTQTICWLFLQIIWVCWTILWSWDIHLVIFLDETSIHMTKDGFDGARIIISNFKRNKNHCYFDFFIFELHNLKMFLICNFLF